MSASQCYPSRVETSTSVGRRKAAILRAIVRDYVRTGQPVGSSRLAERYRLKVSPATIRNDMGSLEDEGYIAQPYTSAGRIPTDQGYRWFVDNWPGPEWPDLPASAAHAIEQVVHHEFRETDEALKAISGLLSKVTESAAVAVAPPSGRKHRLRRLELFQRDPRKATLLLVADSGEVEKGIVEFGQDRTEEDLVDLANNLNRRLSGLIFEDLPVEIAAAAESKSDLEPVSREIAGIMAARAVERVFAGGTANILSPEKFSDIGVAHKIVEALEQPPMLSSLLLAAKSSGAVLVFIGQEVPIEQMRTCGVVFAPYVAESGENGTVGVIGPTRMDYPQTISAVRAVASALSRVFEN